MAESKKGNNFAIQGSTKKKICFHLFFVLMLHIKFQVPSSSGSLVLQPTKGITDRWKDGQTDRQDLLKSKSGGLNIDLNPYVKYQNPNSSCSLDIVLTRFLYCYNGRVEKGA